MSSTPLSQSPTPESTSRPAALIPQVDLATLAKTTRKTLERLVPFTHMRTSSSEASPGLTKIINKINHFTTLIDSSILCEQLGYQLANNCMVLCDPELSIGLSSPVKSAGVPTRGRAGAWIPVGGQPGAADAGVFGREAARELAGQGHEIALKVKEGFSSIAQEMYKIAASTKDDMLVVLVPPDPTHSETLKIHLKDVGTNLVASLNLFSEFSKAVSEVADWWSSVKDDLALEESFLLLPTARDEVEQGGTMDSEKFAWWSEMKEDFQEYYDVINAVHLRFPELLPSSTAAWRSVASARSQAPSSIGHSNDPHQSQSNPVPSASGRGRGGRLGSWLGLKCGDRGKKEEIPKPTRRLTKRKGSKGTVGSEDEKTPKLNETKAGDENITTNASSHTREERPDTKAGMMKKRSLTFSRLVNA